MSNNLTSIKADQLMVRRSTGTLIYLDGIEDGRTRSVFELIDGQWVRLRPRDVINLHHGSVHDVIGYNRQPVHFRPNPRDLRPTLRQEMPYTHEEFDALVHVLHGIRPAWLDELAVAIENHGKLVLEMSSFYSTPEGTSNV